MNELAILSPETLQTIEILLVIFGGMFALPLIVWHTIVWVLYSDKV